MSLTRQFFQELRPLFRMLEEPFSAPAFGAGARRIQGFDLPHYQIARPAVYLTENGSSYIVEAELPGIKKENVEVRVGDNGQSITIEGKVIARSPQLTKQDRFGGDAVQPPVNGSQETREVSTESKFVGSSMFSRTVWLPEPVEGKNVTAKMEDGILTVTVPKAETAQPVHKVEIE